MDHRLVWNPYYGPSISMDHPPLTQLRCKWSALPCFALPFTPDSLFSSSNLSEVRLSQIYINSQNLAARYICLYYYFYNYYWYFYLYYSFKYWSQKRTSMDFISTSKMSFEMYFLVINAVDHTPGWRSALRVKPVDRFFLKTGRSVFTRSLTFTVVNFTLAWQMQIHKYKYTN